MFATPQKRGGASTLFRRTPSTSMPNTKGLFSDGIWHCNCPPRLPATKFQVHKQTRNHGRWFYTCQVAKDSGGCGFFLWNEEAMNREGKVVLANSRSEVSPEVGRTPGKATAARNEGTPTAGRESNAQVDLTSEESEDEEDFGSWPSTQKSSESTNTVSQATLSPETPRKASKLALFTTPGSKRKRDFDHDSNEDIPKMNVDGLPTPITGGGIEGRGRRMKSMSEYGHDDEDIFSTPSSLRTASHNNNSFGIRSPSGTPTPFAHHFQPIEPPSTQESRQDIPVLSSPYDLTPDVLNLLREEGVCLAEETKGKLEILLGRHAMRVSGIAKGRDITRVALKSKDAKIAELGLRIGQLETEKEVDRRLIAGSRNEKQMTSKGRAMW